MSTSPGSESTFLNPGDPVDIRREQPASGTWVRYQGRTGWVVSINRQTFTDDSTYVELGVNFSPNFSDALRADAWFRADEVSLARL